MTKLDGRVAVVAAGGHRAGIDVSRHLAALGAKVVISGSLTDPQRGDVAGKIVDEITAAGGQVVAVDGDSSWSAGARAVATAVDLFGGVHLLVTGAATDYRARQAEMTQREWNTALERGLKLVVSHASAAARQMAGQGTGGSIIVLSSHEAFLGSAPAVGTTDAGLMGLTSAMAMSLRPHDIGVNCLLTALSEEQHARTGSRSRVALPPPIGARARGVAALVGYLASDAPPDLTGHYLYASGSDIAVYKRPLVMDGSTVIVRATDVWSATDPGDALRPLIPMVESGA